MYTVQPALPTVQTLTCTVDPPFLTVFRLSVHCTAHILTSTHLLLVLRNPSNLFWVPALDRGCHHIPGSSEASGFDILLPVGSLLWLWFWTDNQICKLSSYPLTVKRWNATSLSEQSLASLPRLRALMAFQKCTYDNLTDLD